MRLRTTPEFVRCILPPPAPPATTTATTAEDTKQSSSSNSSSNSSVDQRANNNSSNTEPTTTDLQQPPPHHQEGGKHIPVGGYCSTNKKKKASTIMEALVFGKSFQPAHWREDIQIFYRIMLSSKAPANDGNKFPTTADQVLSASPLDQQCYSIPRHFGYGWLFSSTLMSSMMSMTGGLGNK